ncbi:MAG: hypothetical protein ACO1TE_12745 [Prosthecobacter sp.]
MKTSTLSTNTILALLSLGLCSCVNVEAKKTAFFAGGSPAERAGAIWIDFDVENPGGFTQQGTGGAMGVIADGMSNAILAGVANKECAANRAVLKARVNSAIEQELGRSRGFKYTRMGSLTGTLHDKKTTFLPSEKQMAAFATANGLQRALAVRGRRRVPSHVGSLWTPLLHIQPVIDFEVRITTPDGRSIVYSDFGTLPGGTTFNPSLDIRDPQLNAAWESCARQAMMKILASYERDMAAKR